MAECILLHCCCEKGLILQVLSLRSHLAAVEEEGARLVLILH